MCGTPPEVWFLSTWQIAAYAHRNGYFLSNEPRPFAASPYPTLSPKLIIFSSVPDHQSLHPFVAIFPLLENRYLYQSRISASLPIVTDSAPFSPPSPIPE
jgi:hypothetical protein